MQKGRSFSKGTRAAVIGWLLFLAFGCGASRMAARPENFHDSIQGAKRMMAAGLKESAIEELTLLIEMDPKNEEALYLRGNAYRESDEFSSAVEDYRTILQQNPGSVEAHNQLGKIFQKICPHHPRRALSEFCEKNEATFLESPR